MNRWVARLYLPKKLLLQFLLLLAFSISSTNIYANEHSLQKAHRLTKLVIDIYPLGDVLPTYFKTEHFQHINKAQRACVKKSMTKTGYYQYKFREAAKYIVKYTHRVDADIQLLQTGFARSLKGLLAFALTEEAHPLNGLTFSVSMLLYQFLIRHKDESFNALLGVIPEEYNSDNFYQKLLFQAINYKYTVIVNMEKKCKAKREHQL